MSIVNKYTHTLKYITYGTDILCLGNINQAIYILINWITLVFS